MSTHVVKAIDVVRTLSLLALVATLIRANARWSLRARLPVALVAFVSSAALLLIHIL